MSSTHQRPRDSYIVVGLDLESFEITTMPGPATLSHLSSFYTYPARSSMTEVQNFEMLASWIEEVIREQPAQPPVLILLCYSPNYAQCCDLYPIFAALAHGAFESKAPHVRYGKINVEQVSEMTRLFSITALPTIVVLQPQRNPQTNKSEFLMVHNEPYTLSPTEFPLALKSILDAYFERMHVRLTPF